MSLKNIFSSVKNEGYVVGPLDKYLVSLASTDSDRAVNVNAPSQAGTCLRSRFYARMGFESDGVIDARSRRILDNGTKTHERLQEYLKAQGILLCDELPIHNLEYQIQGHTDGLLDLGKEKAILEIKSINDKGFKDLKIVKPEHKRQGLVYLYCVENRRKYLHNFYQDFDFFEECRFSRFKFYRSLYKHLKDGHKYTRKEKIDFQVSLHNTLDTLLMKTENPITKVVFLYENKNTQELKEFCISSKDKEAESILSQVLSEYNFLNKAIEDNCIPQREGSSKSCETCRWCNYKTECWF